MPNDNENQLEGFDNATKDINVIEDVGDQTNIKD